MTTPETHTTPAGAVVPVIGAAALYHHTATTRDGHPGLGTFAVMLGGHGPTWVYCAPNRPPSPITGRFQGAIEPPPLPQPAAQHERCGCSQGQHICGACGKPYWIEIHGCADGFCTYCYARG